MARSDWKFSALPSEIDLGRIVKEASEALDDTHEVIKLTVGNQVFTLCTRETWIKKCPMVHPLGFVTRYTQIVDTENGTGTLAVRDLASIGSLYSAFHPDAVVIFNQDLSRKLRGGVEVKVEVF